MGSPPMLMGLPTRGEPTVYPAAIDLTSPLPRAALIFNVTATIVLHIGEILRRPLRSSRKGGTRRSVYHNPSQNIRVTLTLCDGF